MRCLLYVRIMDIEAISLFLLKYSFWLWTEFWWFFLLLFSSFDPFASKWWPFSLQFFCDLFFWLDWFYHFYCITFGFLILISLWKRWYKALKFKYIKHLCLWSYTNTNRILSYIYLYDLSDSWRKLVKSVQWEQQGDYSWEK